MKIGGIDIAQSVIDAQYRLTTLEKIVQHLIQRAPPGTITQADVQRYQDESLHELQAKFPDAGLQRRK